MKKTQLAASTNTLSNVDWYEIAQQKALLEELNAMLATSPRVSRGCGWRDGFA